MSRTTRDADGDLVLKLNDRDRSLLNQPRGARPASGTTVNLWRLPGTWHVWSPGPTGRTWWLRAVDGKAHAIVDAVTAKSDRGAPVVKAVWKDCIAVLSAEIRPLVIGGPR